MTKELLKELTQARELMDQAKLDEAFEIIENFEKVESLTQEDQLSALILKGKVYRYNRQHEEARKMGELAYQLSQKHGDVLDSIDALLLKSEVKDDDKALGLTLDAEKLLNSLVEKSPSDFSNQKADILHRKSLIYYRKADYKKALEITLSCLELRKKLGNKLDLALTYNLLGWINVQQANHTKALNYAMKSLESNKELNHVVAIADVYHLIAWIFYLEGDYNQALKYCEKSLSIKEITKQTKIYVLRIFWLINISISNFNQALRYIKQAMELAEELNSTSQLVGTLLDSGYLYRIMGKPDLAIEYIERGLTLCEKSYFSPYDMARAFAILITIYLDEDSREIAKRYFSRLSELYNQIKDKENIDISFWYLVSKAFMKKTSARMRDRVEAQALFKEVIEKVLKEWIEKGLSYEGDLILVLSNFCDLLLKELSMHNDPEILDEITPLITKILEIAEITRNYSWLAEGKFLQAKLALIQMNIKEAEKLMIQAQHIADSHGLNLLAWGISSELDKLLGQIDLWDKFTEEKAPFSERIKLASTNAVLERIQRGPTELVDEDPILLLIMDNSGATYFSHPFIANWDHSDLFSSFMSAFNTFMDEIFSRSIDRIRVGENTILVNPVEQFLACYVIKGQSYPALQKLTRFTEVIREDPEIWQTLNKSVKTSEMLELDKPAALKTVIDEIFY